MDSRANRYSVCTVGEKPLRLRPMVADWRWIVDKTGKCGQRPHHIGRCGQFNARFPHVVAIALKANGQSAAQISKRMGVGRWDVLNGLRALDLYPKNPLLAEQVANNIEKRKRIKAWRDMCKAIKEMNPHRKALQKERAKEKRKQISDERMKTPPICVKHRVPKVWIVSKSPNWNSQFKCKLCRYAESKLWIKQHPERSRAWVKAAKKRLREQHPEKYKAIQRAQRNKPRQLMLDRLRGRLRGLVNKGTATKHYGMSRLIGCTTLHLIQHLQSQFTPGMGWHNYGQWHIDHIRPCASFDLHNNDELTQCFHFSNLQPLWAMDNIAKGDKWNP